MSKSSIPSPKEKWKNAIDKFKHAIIPAYYNTGELDDALIDCIRVKMSENDKYIQEIGQSKHIIDSQEYQILSMIPEQLKTYQLFYDKSSQALYNSNNELASTIGKISKDKQNQQAYVIAKDGSLYIATHIGKHQESTLNLTHASFLKGGLAELAGMLSINENGKINFISDNSGHYQPKALDMYRGIKRLQKLMPGVFTEDCKIEIQLDPVIYARTVNQFIARMEKSERNGKLLHEILREQRIEEFQKYKEKLKNISSYNNEAAIANNSCVQSDKSILKAFKDNAALSTTTNLPLTQRKILNSVQKKGSFS